MSTSLLLPGSSACCPLVGMVHLRALPGAPGYSGDLRAVEEAALADARALAEGGVDAMLVENFGDAPFLPGRVAPETVAALTAVVGAVRAAAALPVGVNVLRNDGRSALAIAAATGAAFVRVNVLCGARWTDQGLITGEAHALARDRVRLRAEHVRIWADVDVKHSAPVAPRPLEEEVAETLGRGGADAVIVSGPATGRPVDRDALARARAAAGGRPVLVGSGVTPEIVADLAPHASGLIVGTALKHDGDVRRPVDVERVRALRRACEAARER